MLVAFALIGGTPASSNAGKVMNDPPPAIELSIPPTKPAIKSSGYSSSKIDSVFLFDSFMLVASLTIKQQLYRISQIYEQQ